MCGPDLVRYECKQCLALSTTVECLTSGVCVGVRCTAVVDTLLIRIKMSLVIVVNYMSVDQMAGSKLVGFAHDSVGRAYAMAFTLL